MAPASRLFLITTPQGNILINSDFETTVPFLKANIEKLGFKFSDTKFSRKSCTWRPYGRRRDQRIDRRESEMAIEQDVPALRLMKPGGKEHPIDRILKDGDKVELRGTTLVGI